MLFKALNEQQLHMLAVSLGKKASGKEILLLSGDLGAGKTIFSKGLAEGFGITQHVTSPTFTIINTYTDRCGEFVHMDLYRLEDPSEVDYLGLEEYFGEALTVIEWPERLSFEPPHYAFIELKIVDALHRDINVIIKGTLEEKLFEEMESIC